MPVIASPFVENTLVASVPRPFRLEKIRELLELFLSGREDQDTRVEDIGPTNIWNGRELIWKCEKMRHRPHGEDVRVEEY